MPVGQTADYVKNDGDGRFHLQVFKDGTIKVHRDQYDPDKSPFHAAAHIAKDTPIGPIVKAVFMAIMIGRITGSVR